MTIAWLVALLAVSAHIIVGDLRERRVANRAAMALAALVVAAVAVVAPDPGAGGSPWWTLVSVAGALGVGIGLYGSGQIGAGDVKLAAAAVPLVTWFGSTAWLVYLGCAIVVGMATLIVLGRAAPDGEAGAIPLAPTLLAGLVPAALVGLGAATPG